MKNRSVSFRLVTVTLIISALAAIAALGATSPAVKAFDSVKEFFGMAPTSQPVITAPKSDVAEQNSAEPIEPMFFFAGETSLQNFGTGTGSNTSQTAVTNLFPNPTTGTTYARAGASAPSAPVVLANASNPLGTTGSYIRAVSSSSASVTKVSPMVAYTTGTEFYTSFKALFGDSSAGSTATSGSWTFSQGTGAFYSDNNAYSSAQSFTALRFSYGASGALTLTFDNAGSFTSTGLTNSAFSQGTVYTVEIVGNNKTSGTINYTYNGVAQTVAVQKFDLYINGTRIGDDLTKAGLAANTSINSTTFTAINSTSNVANLFLDDVAVFNAVPAAVAVVAPVVSSSAATSVGASTATLNGNVTSDGGSAVTERGFYWKAGTGVTTADTKVVVSGTTGAFTTDLSSLTPGAQYSFKPYATNSIGTTLGSEQTFNTYAPLSGNYTVGTGGNFTTLTAAVAAYNIGGVSGPVTFSLTSATYGSETYPITIGAASGASSTNTLTIKPNTGISPTFTTGGSNLLVLNGASNVIIDGSNTVGGTTRNLSFAVSAGVTSSAILLSGNTNDNTIKNVVLSGGGDNSQNAVLQFGTTTAGQTINNNTVNNCLIQAYSAGFRPKYAVSMSDARAGAANTGNVLSNNTVNDFSWNGIVLSSGDYQNTTITGNQIFATAAITGAISADVNGIQAGSGLGTVTITGNRIYNLTISGGGMNSIAGISSFITTGDVYTIANNLVSVDSTNVPTYGISSSGTAGTANIYFNSIRIGGAATGLNSYALFAASTSTRNVKNNSIYNARTRVSGSVKNYGLYAGTTNLTSDNNNIFSSGTSGYSFTASNTTTDYATLADWQTATSKDAASVSGDPLYTSSTDLHILTSGATSPVARRGVTISGITTDYDGDTRKGTPDIGADEFNTFTLTASAGANGTISPSGVVPINSGQNQTFTITPNAGYLISDVLVDSVSQGAITSYTFTSVSANHTIAASFAIDNHTVTFNGNGATSGTMANQTSNLPANLTTNGFLRTGYTFVDWATAADGSGTHYADQASYPFAADATLYAQWSLNTFAITASAGSNGAIAPNGVTNVTADASQSYTITPNAGYKVADVLVDGASVGAVTTYTFNNVQATHTISATFAINDVTYGTGAANLPAGSYH
ncbi:MAG TPA: InlB B-repeat-containing protein, partial [Pyrinomonadaceae bacterium]|nr:InlB B-repeat-containing protein [Pyrinomonadaceae bacterium]